MEEIRGELKEPSSEKDIENRKSSIKKRLFSWVHDNYDKLFLAILAVSFIINIIIFIKTMQQPLWWDEADYLSAAKKWGLGINVGDIWYYRRGFLWPLIGAAFFKLGIGEIGIKFLESLLSTGIVAVSYFLVKEMFDKKKAVIISLLISLSWIMFFFTGRVLTEIPSTFLLLLSLLFFWKGYILKKGNKFLYLFGLFFALAVLTRMQILMFAPAFLVLIFVKEKLKMFRNKHLWITLGIFLLIFIPQIILYASKYGNPITDILSHYFGISGVSNTVPIQRTASSIFSYFANLPYILGGQFFLGQILFYLFLAGSLLFFLDLILGLDKIFKNEELQKRLFIFLWIIIPFLVLGYITDYVEQRYAIPDLIFLFLIVIYPLSKIGNYLTRTTKLSKKLVFFLILLIVVSVSISSIVWGNQLTDSKKNSYVEIMQAGEWIKANSTSPDDLVMTQSRPQIVYYAERSVQSPAPEILDNQTVFENTIREIHPKYLVLSVYEKSPDWLYNYPSQHQDKLMPVYVLPINSQQPTVIVYEFKY